jgi:hypothetical protein
LSENQRAEALRELSEKGRFRTEAMTYAKDGTTVYVEGITIALRRGCGSAQRDAFGEGLGVPLQGVEGD